MSIADTTSYIAMFLITILLQFNFNKSNKIKLWLWVAMFCLKLMSNLIWLSYSINSLKSLKHKQDCKEDVKKLKTIRYRVAIVCYSVDTIRQCIGLVDTLDSSLVLINYTEPLNGYVMTSFATKFLKLFMSSSIERYCKHKDYQSSKRGNKEKLLLIIAFSTLAFIVLDIVGKIINVAEQYGYFVIENKIVGLGNNITYKFNFSSTMRIICMFIMIIAYTMQSVIEKKRSIQIDSPNITTIEELNITV